MSVIMGNSNSRVLILVLAFTMIVLVPATRSVFADQQPITNTQSIELFVGGSIVVMSDRPSIQRTFLSGNLTAVSCAGSVSNKRICIYEYESGGIHAETILRLSYRV